jgi:small-conductance mechanosensitive channel
MSEEPPTTPQPIETSRTAEEIEREENERYEARVAEHPVAKTKKDSSERWAEKIAECEAMMDSFEKTHDLDALRTITQFSSKEERESSPRQPALNALSLIFKQLKDLNKRGALQGETRDAFAARYEVLSQAVGNITGDKNGKIFDIVVHDRRTPLPS